MNFDQSFIHFHIYFMYSIHSDELFTSELKKKFFDLPMKFQDSITDNCGVCAAYNVLLDEINVGCSCNTENTNVSVVLVNERKQRLKSMLESM